MSGLASKTGLRVITACETRKMNGPGSDIAPSIVLRWVSSYLQPPYERSREALGDPANSAPASSVTSPSQPVLAPSAKTMKQERGLGIISFGRHHQLGYTDIKRCLDWFTGGQSLVEADAEPDR